MDFYLHKPSKTLAQYVKSYWMIENIMDSGATHMQRIVPSGLIELSFYLSDIPESMDQSKSINGNSIVTGQIKNYFDIRVSGNLSVFSVYFFPHGLAAILDMPVCELSNQTIPLKYLISDFTNELEDQLAATKKFIERVLIIEKFLCKMLGQVRKKYQYERINHSIDIINQRKGFTDIRHLASAACLSRKQFERTFLDFVGSSPKQFLKVIRFQHAIYQKSLNTKLSLTQLALDSGYYDQSHMIADFIALSGKTPKDYFGQCDSVSDYFH